MKRAFSDDECDDAFVDDDHKTISSPTSTAEGGGGGGSTRKKRRGVIEKRRRDRINQSLCELRRLVPAAFEKQGSAKLEKAEILQMTVDHLKILSSKGLNGYNVDTAALALDYRSIGFRECMSEVSRYLVSVEGLDIQDPLRVRLGSHLQCYSAQREIASKAAMQHQSSSSWNYNSSFQPQYAPPNYSSLPQASHPSPPGDPLLSSTQTTRLPSYADTAARLSSSAAQVPLGTGGGAAGPPMLPVTSSPSQQTSLSCLSQVPQFHSSSMLSPHPPYPSSSASSAGAPFQQPSVRHHRPWGTDLAF